MVKYRIDLSDGLNGMEQYSEIQKDRRKTVQELDSSIVGLLMIT